MSNQSQPNDEDTRRLVVAVTDFLREQLETRDDFVPEDRDCLEIAIQCLEMAYGLDDTGYVQLRFARPLLDIFHQVTNPVPVRDSLRADAHKDDGNSLMRQNMYAAAEEEYSNAIALDKWNAIYYCNRASARIEQQHFFDAISDCRQALLLNPDYAKAYARMGQAYALLNRPREAARCFRQALQQEPENERYRNNLRAAESRITRPDAMELFTTILGSLLGARPLTAESTDPNIALPSSFMIIRESHPGRANVPRQNQRISEVAETDVQSDRTEAVGSHNNFEIIFPLPYGIIDEGSDECQIHQPQMRTRNHSHPGEIMTPEIESGDEYIIFETDNDIESTMPSIPEDRASETREVYKADGSNVKYLSNEEEKETSQKLSTDQLSKKNVEDSVHSQIKPEEKVTQSSVIKEKKPHILSASNNISHSPHTPSPLSIEENEEVHPFLQNYFEDSKKLTTRQRSHSISDFEKSKIKQLSKNSISNRLSEGNQRIVGETTKDKKCPIKKSSSSEVIEKMKDGFKSHLISSINESSASDISGTSHPCTKKNDALLNGSNGSQETVKTPKEVPTDKNKDIPFVDIKQKTSGKDHAQKYSTENLNRNELSTKKWKPSTEAAENIQRDQAQYAPEENHEILNELLNKVEENLTQSAEKSGYSSNDNLSMHPENKSNSRNNIEVTKKRMSENNVNNVLGNEKK